jgi:quercetin dioxygenase-like cupin family protein
MELNTDLTKRVVVHGAEMPWTPSPEPGIERRMFERSGGEVARATSMVRYAAGSQFAAHTHGMGEEFLVLEGALVDEHGQYPPGTYVRNPWGTQHTPGAPQGCILLVKLRQMAPDDRRRVARDTGQGSWASVGPGIEAQTLHEHGTERVELQRWAPGSALVRVERPRGIELFVLAGDCEDQYEHDGRRHLRRHTWARLPVGSVHGLRTSQGCLLWIKHT